MIVSEHMLSVLTFLLSINNIFLGIWIGGVKFHFLTSKGKNVETLREWGRAILEEHYDGIMDKHNLGIGLLLARKWVRTEAQRALETWATEMRLWNVNGIFRYSPVLDVWMQSNSNHRDCRGNWIRTTRFRVHPHVGTSNDRNHFISRNMDCGRTRVRCADHGAISFLPTADRGSSRRTRAHFRPFTDVSYLYNLLIATKMIRH